MATTIKIGSVQIRDEDYAIQANAILGIRGTGKTTLAKSIAEQMLDAKIPIIVFDPTGVWRYLKRAAQKKAGYRGYPIVVAGGVEPDLQLTPSTAAEIVRAAIKEEISLVIDLYDKKLSKGDWRRIVRDCFRTLMYENEGVRHIFLEEAAEFAPQRIQDGETYAEVEKVVRMGGNASLGITLINQRSQEVNKAVLELCENLILMRQRGSHAIDAIEKWIDKLEPEYARTIKGDLPNLATGRAFVFRGDGPPQATSSNKLHTFHPDRRHPEAIKRAGMSPDVDKFVSRLGERLKDKTVLDTVETLRSEVKRLNAELKGGAKMDSHAEDTRQKNKNLVEGISQRDLKIKLLHKVIATQGARLRKIHELASVIDDVPEFGASAVDRPDVREAQHKQTKALREMVDNAVTAKTRPMKKLELHRELVDGDELTGPQRAMLKSMYWLRDEPLTLSKVAFYGGYKPGRYSSDRIGELRQKGLVHPKSFLITDAGIELIAGTASEKPTGRELREIVRGMLTGPQNAVLDALLESAAPMSLAEISEATGYEVGRYLSDRVGELRTLELVLGNDKSGGAQPSPFFRE